MKKETWIRLALYAVILSLIAFLVIFYLLPTGEARPNIPNIMPQSMPQPQESYPAIDAPLAPTGTIVAGAGSLLTFTAPVRYFYIFNDTGATAYFKLNTITTTVTPTDFHHFVLDDGHVFYDNWLRVKNVSVYVTPTAGFSIGGWSVGYVPPTGW